MSDSGGVARKAVARRMAARDPKLAVQLMLESIPAVVAGTNLDLEYDLDVSDLGLYHIAIHGGQAQVTSGGNGHNDFKVESDAASIASLIAGASPLRLIFSRKLHIRGSKRKALKLRNLSSSIGLRDLARLGIKVDPDLVYRAAAYAIDPQWTSGQNFVVLYRLSGEKSGSWFIQISDGEVQVTSEFEGQPDAEVSMSYADWLKILGGEFSPALAYARAITKIEGKTHYVTLLGRWLDRADGRDLKELEREERQSQIQ